MMLNRFIQVSAVSVMLAGCGAEKMAYDKVERSKEEITVSSLDTDSLWLYMPSTGSAPRYAITQRGFFQGEPKLVKLKFTKDNGIYAEELDRDKLFADQPSRWASANNRLPVLTIPGEFREYRCRLNDYDECTNKEEINKDDNLKWNKKSHFVPDYSKIKSIAKDNVNTWFTSQNVVESAEAELVHYEYNPEKGVINVEVKRTFTAAPGQFYGFGSSMKDLSFTTNFFYSLVKLDKLASKDYSPVYYPTADSLRYGFFKNENEPLTATGEANRQGEDFNLLNRFNPNDAFIEYYLSDSYHHAGSELYLGVTLEAVAEMNKILKDTGVPTIKIMNPSSKAGVHTGDLRYNVLNLITDPLDNGLLGYGPSAANPLTGEIVHAHVNQYADVIRTATRRSWNALARHYNNKTIARPDEYKPEEAKTNPANTNNNGIIPSPSYNPSLTFADITKDLNVDRNAGNNERIPDWVDNLRNTVPSTNVSFEFDPVKVTELAKAHRQREKLLAQQNVFTENAMWVSTRSKGLLKGINYANGYFDNTGIAATDPAYNTKLKRWPLLSAAQQKAAGDVIAKHMFKSTLVHEFGHNLGLRHNFMGSVDKANYYTQEEAQQLGVDKTPAYSSIMDYAASMFDELPMFGKYDVAALRFGYGREVEALLDTKDDKGEDIRESQFVSLKPIDQKITAAHKNFPRGALDHLVNNMKEFAGDKFAQGGIKTYNYCTDENVTVSTICNRFDEGTNVKEVTQFRIQRYKDSYEQMNLRDGRDDFYDFHLLNYTITRLNQFNEIRDVIEDFGELDYQLSASSGIINSYGQTLDNLYSRSCRGDVNSKPADLQFVCHSYEAVKEAADFFVSVMQTPDKVCELATVDNNGYIQSNNFVKLSDIWSKYGPYMRSKAELPTSCFDEDLAVQLARPPAAGATIIRVLSETRDGVVHANMRANNPHESTVNAIDKMGIWPDKLLAAHMLVQRGSFNRSTDHSNMALLDFGSTSRGFYRYLAYLANGNYGVESYRTPVFVDAEGKAKETFRRYVPERATLIDAVPSYLWPIKRFFPNVAEYAHSLSCWITA